MTHSKADALVKDVSEFLPTGRFIVAVSGGVDSMALLHMLSKSSKSTYIVAHVDHGIREDSMKDLQLVREAAQAYGMPFYCAKIHLGSHASEELARDVRYGFLFSIMQRQRAAAVITAHHKDDLLETSLLHVLRGTGRRGLAGFNRHESILRPLSSVTKAELIEYATQHQLVWHEDSTNQSGEYKRNAIRHTVLPTLEATQPGFAETWHSMAAWAGQLNTVIDQELQALIAQHAQRQGEAWTFDRYWFVMLPHSVAREVLVQIMKTAGVQDISRKRVEQLTIHLKTGKINARYDCDKRWMFSIERAPEHVTLLKLALKQGEC